jgi:hypothetical protein
MQAPLIAPEGGLESRLAAGVRGERTQGIVLIGAPPLRTGPGSGGEIQLTDALQRSLSKGPLYGLILRGERYDAGDKKDFLRANLAYALKRKEYRKYLEPLLASRLLNKGKRVQS